MKTKNLNSARILITILSSVLLLLCLAACGGETNDSPTQEQKEQIGATGNSAIDGLSEKIRQNPNDPNLYAQRAEMFYENNGYDEAILDLQKALKMDSTNPAYLHLLADVYLDYFKSRQALKTMEVAAAHHPDRIPTLLKLSEVQFILKQYEASMRTIDQVLKRDPQNAEAFFMFGRNFKETGDTARAINSYQQAVELDPDLVDAWIILGNLQAATGSSLAIQYFDNAIRVAPNNILAIHSKADYLKDYQDDLDGAIELYKKINTIDPQYEESYFNAGLLYMELDSLEQAYQQFDLAIKYSPTHIRAYFFRGYAAEMMGDTEQARKDYEQALKFAPDYEYALKGLERLKEKNQER